MCSVFLCESVLVCMCDGAAGGYDNWCVHGRMMLLESNIHKSRILYRSRVRLREWLPWWQHKSLKLEMSCGDSRRRLLLMAVTTIIDVYYGSRSSSARLTFGNCVTTWDPSQFFGVLFFFFTKA